MGQRKSKPVIETSDVKIYELILSPLSPYRYSNINIIRNNGELNWGFLLFSIQYHYSTSNCQLLYRVYNQSEELTKVLELQHLIMYNQLTREECEYLRPRSEFYKEEINNLFNSLVDSHFTHKIETMIVNN